MKLFAILTFLLLVPVSAQATGNPAPQGSISKQQLDQYYMTCVNNAAATETRFSPQAQQQFCACTASKIMEGRFSLEDMETMSDTSSPNSRMAMNKMIVNVYAPCMSIPTQEYHYTQCVANPQTATLTQKPEKLCLCAATAVAKYMDQNGPALFQSILGSNPTIEDPMGALYQNPQFQQYAQSQLMGCMRQ